MDPHMWIFTFSTELSVHVEGWTDLIRDYINLRKSDESYLFFRQKGYEWSWLIK